MPRLLRIAAGLLALFVIVSQQVGALDAPVTMIKLATLAPSGTSYDLILRQMGEKWLKATNSTVTLRVYPGGSQGSEADIVRRMNVGELQAAMLSVGGLSEIDPTVTALQGIPMLFRSLDEEEYVRNKMRGDFERRLLAKGFVPLFWGDGGWVRFFSRQPGITPEDLKSMKIFVTASNSAKEMQIMQGLGYRVVALDWADALIQLQTGGIDAVPAPPILALSGQYCTVVKHMTELNWVPLVGATVMTRRAWDSIPETARDQMMTAASEAGKQIQDASRRESNQAVETMKKKWGLTVHPVDANLEQQWRAFAEGVYPRIRGTLVPADVFDEARRLVGEYRAGPR